MKNFIFGLVGALIMTCISIAPAEAAPATCRGEPWTFDNFLKGCNQANAGVIDDHRNGQEIAPADEEVSPEPETPGEGEPSDPGDHGHGEATAL